MTAYTPEHPDAGFAIATTRRPRAMRWAAVSLCAALLTASALLLAGATEQKKDNGAAIASAADLPQLIWRDPGDMGALDLVDGAGGRAHAPDPAGGFTFVKEDLAETSPKFWVTDSQGVEWKVKLGPESKPETAATRFLWAAGYFVDEDYYIAELTVKDLPKLQRGQEFVSGGVVHSTRLERKLPGVKKLGNWDWFDNPFTGSRELNGLRVMMSLLNNWDLKAVNNSIYAVDGERHYLVSDAGATFGNTGNTITRSKGVPEDYDHSKFIAKTTPDFIDFVLHSRPFFLAALDVSNYNERAKMEEITKHIPRADAKWLGERLSRITGEQVRDAFRTAGYGPADVESLTAAIAQRIAALRAL
jgi:hypothetical protein